MRENFPDVTYLTDTNLYYYIERRRKSQLHHRCGWDLWQHQENWLTFQPSQGYGRGARDLQSKYL